MAEGEEIPQKIEKEEQATLVPQKMNQKVEKEEFYSILKMVAPGTNFRAALDGIVRAGKGAIIVVENEAVEPLLDGGFKVNCKFTPQRLVELSKMDAAMILSRDLKRINHANVTLTPDASNKTNETGTRHKAAERTAKQAGCICIAISERRHEISLFYKTMKHVVKSTDEILRKANGHIQLLEKQRDLFDVHVEKLTRSELRNYLNLNQAVLVIQKGRLIQKIADDLRKNILELGNEGTLLKTRLKEIVANVERETDLVLKDYSRIGAKKSKLLLESLSYDELLDAQNIRNALAYEKFDKSDFIKGWRILSKTSLMESEIAQLVKETGHLGKALHSNTRFYSLLFGEEKALSVKEELERIKLNY
jgi:diadenylate cyclase